jgi:hypothetical protein
MRKHALNYNGEAAANSGLAKIDIHGYLDKLNTGYYKNMKNVKSKAGIEDDENILSAMMGQKIRYPDGFKNKILADGPESNQFRYDEMNKALIKHQQEVYKSLRSSPLPKQEMDTLNYNMQHLHELSPQDQMRLYDEDALHKAHDLAQQII